MNRSPNHCFLSLIVPCYNEGNNIDAFFEAVTPVLESTQKTFEVVCINDGSKDDTLEALRDMQARDSRIVIIDLSRNFGKEAALTAGLEHARGQVVIPIDADLQHPPELILEMIQKWEEGYKMVTTTIKKRNNKSFIVNFLSNLFYRLVNRYADVPIPKNTGDYRLMDREVVDAIRALPERNRFMKGIFAWVGFKQTTIMFELQKRHAGKTKWSFFKLWTLALDGFCSLTSFPLKIWTYIGLLIASFTLFYAFIVILKTLLFGVDVPGYASLIVAVLFLGSIQLISLGVIGEYISRIYEETKRRPIYIKNKVYKAPQSE